MTTAIEIDKRVNYVYRDVYLKRRYGDGSFDASWIDITRFVAANSLQSISYRLDSGDYDIGFFTVDNVDLVFLNSSGKFNDPNDSRSLWAGLDTRHLSKVKIVAGYRDSTTLERVTEIAFEGVLDERSVVQDDSDTVSATIMSRQFLLSSVDVPAGTLSSGVLASDAIFILCSRPEVTDHVSVLEANITPDNDITLDTCTPFNNKKLNDVLNDILLLTNSVMYIDSTGALIVCDRSRSARIKWAFYLNSESGQRDNVYRVTNFNNGRQRVKNYWQFSGTTLVAQSSAYLLERYGITKRSVDSSAITTTATRQDIIDTLLAEWQYPKAEVEIETDYLANEVGLFDLVTLDIRPTLSRESPLPLCGSSVCGTAVCAKYVTGLRTEADLGWKVIAIEHDIEKVRTTLKLRVIGNQLNDGYLPMVLSKTYAVTFAGDTYKDIDTSAEDIDARYSKVEVLNTADDYATEEFRITRPDQRTIRLTAGSATTGTYRVLVVEVEA